ncbi:MAG: hypothetical protein ACI84C_001520 [Flavobacteriales bacterium]|jgi:hypothetical protein
MKFKTALTLLTCLFSFGNYAQETSTITIPIEIIFPDTFHHEFGYFGDEEGMVLEQAPLFAHYHELGGLQWELRTFHYQPQDPFTPTDTAMLIEFRGSNGAGQAMFIDTTIFVFNALIDGVLENTIKTPSFWPNPNSSPLLNTSKNLSDYQLFNAHGELMQRGKSSENGQIPMDKCEEGLYYLNLDGSTLKIVRL